MGGKKIVFCFLISPLFAVSLLLFAKLKAYLESLVCQVLHRSAEECHMLL
jgi:hypothetical protein